MASGSGFGALGLRDVGFALGVRKLRFDLRGSWHGSGLKAGVFDVALLGGSWAVI